VIREFQEKWQQFSTQTLTTVQKFWFSLDFGLIFLYNTVKIGKISEAILLLSFFILHIIYMEN